MSSFPAITEPFPSVTYSISPAFAAPEHLDYVKKDLNNIALSVLSSIAPPSGRGLALDWQHQGFYFAHSPDNMSAMNVEQTQGQPTANYSQLVFAKATRAGGGGRTEIVHWDYLVDGVSLRERLKVGDFISPFGWLRPDADARFRQILLLKLPSDLRPGRVPIFVCPECADYGCGAVTATVKKDGEFIIWEAFAYENNYSDDADPLEEHLQQRLIFHRSEYWSVIHSMPLSACDTV